MITLVNTNLMRPPIAPLGLEYLTGSLLHSGLEAEVLDLCLAPDWHAALAAHFSSRNPELVGLSFRNVDDSFWPSARSFVPLLKEMVGAVRTQCRAPLVLGGVGFSLFPERLLEETGVEYGIMGDGEGTIPALLEAVRGKSSLEKVPGLLWRDGDRVRSNSPNWPTLGVEGPWRRDILDNEAYMRLGGQLGLETSRGCPRKCGFCADWKAKGTAARLRDPAAVAAEAAGLARRGLGILHLCDGDFNVPPGHAEAVSGEMAKLGLGDALRWYAYLAAEPFTPGLARAMRAAGCAGINFTGPSASPAMLRSYAQPHGREALARAVWLCREYGIASMVDLLLGGPGETPGTVREGVAFLKEAGPDCVGAALGVRLYPGLPMTERLERERPLEGNPGLRRRYDGPVDLLQPTYYISPALGPAPAAVVREAIGGDERFFPPSDEPEPGYNYSDNTPLEEAIAAGARGAYWEILRGK